MRFRTPLWPQLLPTEIIVGCATLGPVGRVRYAPGTWGSLAGLFYQVVFFHNLALQPLGVVWTLLFCGIGLWLAVALCGEAEVRLRQRDPGMVVLDEFVVMPLCFLGWPLLAGQLPPWAIMVVGFGLFRVFDVLKPFGIRRLQDLPGGWGVVADDVAAALVTCVVMHGGRLAWLWWGPAAG